jgi:large subunit ribosomal protein L31
MKPGIHPDYHKITIKMTDGETYESYSTYGKEGDVLQLDVDSKTHPAWVGGVNLRKTGQMEKFTNKFAFLDRKSNQPAAEAPKKEAPAAEQKPAEKAEKKAKTEKKADKKDDAA